MYMKGKKIALGVLRSYGDQDSLSTFTEPRSPPEDIINVGSKVLAKVVLSRQIDIAGQTSLHPVQSVDHLCHQGLSLSRCRQLPQPPSSIHTLPIFAVQQFLAVPKQ